MSFDTGPGGYTPPPPKKGLSPWAWVGIGCGTLTLLGFGGCAVMAVMFKNAMNSAADPAASLADIEKAGIPFYPGSERDDKATKAAGGAMGVMGAMTGGKMKMSMVALTAPDAPDTVLSWYKVKLAAAGYSQEKGENKNPMGRNIQQVQFRKGDVAAIVQTQNPPAGKSGCVLILTKITGMPRRGDR